jgi:hypothetical protein
MTDLITGYDSTDPADIPDHAALIFAYIDGRYATNANVARALHPKAIIKTITSEHTAGADIIDCETGLATPSTAAGWARSEHQAGRHPTIYCNHATWDAVKNAVRAAGVTGKVDYWIAAYPGIGPELYPGTVAHQYLGSPEGGSPGHFDVSVADPDWVYGRKPEPDTARPLSLITAHLLRKIDRAAARADRRLTKRLSSKVPLTKKAAAKATATRQTVGKLSDVITEVERL